MFNVPQATGSNPYGFNKNDFPQYFNTLCRNPFLSKLLKPQRETVLKNLTKHNHQIF